MTKQEKIAVKNSLMTIKDSVFRDAWDEIVSDHPYVLQDDYDIEDDFIAQEDNKESKDAISIGRSKMKKRSELIGGTSGVEPHIDCLRNCWEDITIFPIDGVAQGWEEGLGFYLMNRQVFVKKHSSVDMAMVISADEDEMEYLKSLGYTNISELFDNQRTSNN